MVTAKANWLEVFWICPKCSHQNNRREVRHFPCKLQCDGCDRMTLVGWPRHD